MACKIYKPKYSLGGWMNDHKQGILGGALATAGVLGTVGTLGIGAPAGAALIGSGAGMIAGDISNTQNIKNSQEANEEAQRQNILNNTITQRQNELATANNPEIPQYELGGTFVPNNQYMGQTHQGPNEGIPIDQNGNPSIQTNNPTVGLAENNEVSYGDFIFSDKITLAGAILKDKGKNKKK